MLRESVHITQAAAFFLAMLLCLAILAPAVTASPPHPDLLKQTAMAKKPVPYFMKNEKDLRSAGINSGTNPYAADGRAAKLTVDPSGAVVGQFNILAVLVRFPDKTGSTGASFFDNLMYSTSQISVRHYYREASYAQLDIVTLNAPSSLGWVTAPQVYSYYTNNESGVNPDSYPNNAQKLVEDIVALIDGSVDYSDYDNNNDGFVDVLMIIHAGPGAEYTGSDADIWSHQWAITPHLTSDGVYVSNYTIQPEYMESPGDMTIGVFAHELGHGFGLPDLYDTDYSSNGIGAWGVMSFGSWLGPTMTGDLPSYFCAWSRAQLGFLTPTRVTSNIDNQEIGNVNTTRDCFRLWTSGNLGNEYFLVENRQRTGYDTYLPTSGLLIWHVDEAMNSNDNEWIPGMNPSYHYLVALEQCDGQFELEWCTDMGDGNDVFPGIGCGNIFNAQTPTNSNSYTLGPSLVSVGDISAPASVMQANFRVSLTGSVEGDDPGGLLPTTLSLAQNYPNPFNPTTTICFYSPDPGAAKVEVINCLGRPVKTLLDGQVVSGYTEVVWDGTNAAGDAVASGIYLYRVSMEGAKQVKKMVLVR